MQDFQLKDEVIKLIRKMILLILCCISIIPLVHSVRTPTTTTIPPITAQSAGVYFQCNPFQSYPGSVTIGSSGFVLIQCPNGGAVTFDGVLTPTFTLGIGYSQVAIVLHGANGNPCNFNFRSLPVGTVTVPIGSFLNRTLTFSSSPIQGQMLTAVYDYCLQYINAPTTGLAGFDIIWT